MTDTSVSQPGALDGALPLAAETAAAVPGAGQGGPTADPPIGAEGDSTAAPAQGEIPVGVPAEQGTTPEAVADPFQETWQTLLAQALELLEVGGPVVAILLGMSVIALAIVLLKLWQFARLRLGARRFADRALEHWQAGRHQEALATLERQSSPLAALNWLERRVERFGHRLEDTVTRVFTVGLRPLPQPAAVPLRRSGGQYAS